MKRRRSVRLRHACRRELDQAGQDADARLSRTCGNETQSSRDVGTCRRGFRVDEPNALPRINAVSVNGGRNTDRPEHDHYKFQIHHFVPLFGLNASQSMVGLLSAAVNRARRIRLFLRTHNPPGDAEGQRPSQARCAPPCSYSFPRVAGPHGTSGAPATPPSGFIHQARSSCFGARRPLRCARAASTIACASSTTRSRCASPRKLSE